MLCIYEPTETNFSHNGIFPLLPTTCTVTEELNGAFELQLTHSVDSIGRWKAINEFYIIRAPTPRGDQLFRIYRPIKNLNHTVTAYARHITYDDIRNSFSVSAEGVTPDSAIKLIYDNLVYKSGFTVSSDIDGATDIVYTDVNPIDALLDESTGLVKKLNGELLRDNFNIKLCKAIGNDNGVQIRHRKNLTGLTFTTDISNIVTMIKPIAADSKNNDLLLPEVYIKSPLFGAYHRPLIDSVKYSDIKLSKDYTDLMAYEEMRSRVLQLFDEGMDKPDINAKIEFVHLGDTEEFKEYRDLEHIHIGDTVTVIHEGLNIGVKTKCIRYTYDCLLRRYESMEIGKPLGSIAESIGSIGAVYNLASQANVEYALLEARISKLENPTENPA